MMFEQLRVVIGTSVEDDEGNLYDDCGEIIGIRDELMHSIWSSLWISRDTEGVQTRARKIVRREMLISLSFCFVM